MSYYLEDLSEGMEANSVNIVTDDKIKAFADVSGDTNPIHLDEDYAKTTMFKERIAHGMLSAGFISAVLGTQLPGNNTIYLGQSLKFMAPVKIGDEVTTKVTITELDSDKGRVKLSTDCFIGENKVLTGEANVMVPKKPKS